MSPLRPLLNGWLRLTEKRLLARETSVERLRRAFAGKAWLFFRAPQGTRLTREGLGDVPALWINADRPGPLILYLHGGGYFMGSPDTHRAMLGRLSRDTGLPACLPDYRLAPEARFPAALEDALSCYRAVMARPGGVILGGDSAGGGLALSVLAEILRTGLRVPLGTFAFSPLTDLSFSGESVARNAQRDAMLPVSRLQDTVALYVPEGADVKDPRLSPLWGAFRGAGPVWLSAGDTEILLDDTRRMAERLRAQGVAVTEEIGHDLPHVWPIFHNVLPEARATLRRLAGWINSLSRPAAGS